MNEDDVNEISEKELPEEQEDAIDITDKAAHSDYQVPQTSNEAIKHQLSGMMSIGFWITLPT